MSDTETTTYTVRMTRPARPGDVVTLQLPDGEVVTGMVTAVSDDTVSFLANDAVFDDEEGE